MSVKFFPITSAWMPDMNRSYSTSIAATAASSSIFPSTTSPFSKNASRCAGVRCAARTAATAHASHDQALSILWCAQAAARATDEFCSTWPLIRM